MPIPASFVYAIPVWGQRERENGKGNVCRSFYSDYSEYAEQGSRITLVTRSILCDVVLHMFTYPYVRYCLASCSPVVDNLFGFTVCRQGGRGVSDDAYNTIRLKN